MRISRYSMAKPFNGAAGSGSSGEAEFSRRAFIKNSLGGCAEVLAVGITMSKSGVKASQTISLRRREVSYGDVRPLL